MELSKFIFIVFYVVYLTLAEGDNVWTKKRKLHRAKTLRTDRLHKLAKLTDDPSQLQYFKENLLKPMLIERVVDTEGNRIVQQHIRDHLTNYGWTIEDDQFQDETPIGRKTFTNIIATQNPSAPRKLVLACHHDSKLFKNIRFVGATDSAVPCAMMLDLARLMNQTLWKEDKKKANDITLQFIFFDGEEAFRSWTSTDSIYGARHLAEKLSTNEVEVDREVFVKELDTIDLMVLLDLIGTATPTFRNWFRKTEGHFERLKKIEMKLIKEKLLTLPDHFSTKSNNYFIGELMPDTHGIEDDHIPFLRRDVPVLHLISYPFPQEWHKASDNEKALDYQTINNLGKILRIFVAEYLHLSP